MEIEPLLDELRVLASNGLEYADDSWEEDRWERVLDLVSEYAGETVDRSPEEIHQRFAREIGHVTTKVGAEAAVLDNDERVLVIQRADDETWGLPGGWVEPGESPTEAAVRETREETGLTVESGELVGVYNRRPGEYGFHGQVNIVYRCRVVGGGIDPSHEALTVEYRRPEAVGDWHADHRSRVRDVLAQN